MPFHEIDLSQSPGAVVDMLKANGGRRSAPMVRIGSQVLVDPQPAELEAALKAHRK